MKTAIVIITTILILVTPSKIISQETNDATLDETINWLKGKLAIERSNFSRKVSFDKKNGLLIVRDEDTSTVPYVSTDYIPLSKIDPSSFTIWEPKDNDYIIFNFEIIGKEKLIKRTVVEKWEGGKTNNVTDNYIQWTFPKSYKENNLPERIKKAFLHAIKLCGGIKEKF